MVIRGIRITLLFTLLVSFCGYWYYTHSPRQNWKISVDAQLSGCVLAANGLVCFGTYSGILYGIERASGQKKWQLKLPTAPLSSPLVAGGDFIYCVGGGRHLYAVDTNTGKVVWKFVSTSSMLPSVLYRTTLIFADGVFLRGCDRESGQLLWSLGLGQSRAPQQPTVADDTLYVGFTGAVASSDSPAKAAQAEQFLQGGILTVDLLGRQVGWIQDLPGNTVRKPPAVTTETVSCLAVDRYANTQIHTMERATGRTRWKRPASSTPPLAHGDRVYYSDLERNGLRVSVYALDAMDGGMVWRRSLSGFMSIGTPTFSTPSVVDGRVYLGINDTLYVLDAEDGQDRWRFQIKGEGRIHLAPAVEKGTAYFASSRGFLYAVRVPR